MNKAGTEGKVIDGGGGGLKGVAVSNGETIVLSDGDGRFRLAVDPQRHTHVSVTVPSGFASVNGFYRSLDQCRGGRTIFQLKRRPMRAKNLRFVAITDIHYGHLPPAGAAATRVLRNQLAELSARCRHAQFIIATGDLSDDGKRANLQKVRQLFDEQEKPIIAVFGNHDRVHKRDQPHTPEPWTQNYLDVFGPMWYSFDWASFHFTIDNNFDRYHDPPMLAAKRRWLTADLELATKRGLECIVAAHFPPTMSYARRLARLGVRLILGGHFHCFRTYRLGRMRVLSFPSLMRGGIDMMPRGYLDVQARPGEDVRFEYRPLGPIFAAVCPGDRNGHLWSRKVSHYFHRAAPIVDQQRLYVPGSDDLRGGGGAVHCLDAITGRKIWARAIEEAIKNVVTLHEHRLFTITQLGTLLCLNKSDGRLLWKRRLRQWPDRWINTAPAVAGDLVIVGHHRGGLEAFALDGGQRRWHLNTGRTFTNSNGDVWPEYRTPVVDEGRVLIAFQNKSLSCLAGDCGRVLWQFSMKYGYYSPGPVLWRDSVWVPNSQLEEDLSRISLTTGNRLAQVRGKGIPVSWSVAGDWLFLVVFDKWTGGQAWLQCRSARSGRMGWEQALGRDPAHAYAYYAGDGPNCQAVPVLVRGRLFVACTDGFVREFDPKTGRPAGRFELPSPMFSAPVFGDDRFWVSLWSGRVACRRF